MKEQNELIAALIEQLENYKSLNSQLNDIRDLSSNVLNGFKEEMSRIHHAMNTILQSINDSSTEIETVNNKFISIQETVTQYASQVSMEQAHVVQASMDSIRNIDALFKQLETLQITFLQEQIDSIKALLVSFTESTTLIQSQSYAQLEARMKVTDNLATSNTHQLMAKVEGESQVILDEIRKDLEQKFGPLRLMLGINLIVLLLIILGMIFVF